MCVCVTSTYFSSPSVSTPSPPLSLRTLRLRLPFSSLNNENFNKRTKKWKQISNPNIPLHCFKFSARLPTLS